MTIESRTTETLNEQLASLRRRSDTLRALVARDTNEDANRMRLRYADDLDGAAQLIEDELMARAQENRIHW